MLRHTIPSWKVFWMTPFIVVAQQHRDDPFLVPGVRVRVRIRIRPSPPFPLTHLALCQLLTQ